MAKKKAPTEKAAAPEGAAQAPAPKAAPRGTKAQAIRDALKDGRDKSPTEIAADLTAQGWQVKPGEVSNIKFQLKKAKKRARKAAAKTEAPAADDLISMAALEAAKKLVKELGGVDKAKRAIESLGRLVD